MLKYTAMNDHMFKRLFTNKRIFCYYANLFAKTNLKQDEIELAFNEITNTIEGKTNIADVVFACNKRLINFEAQNDNYSRITNDEDKNIIDDDAMDQRMINQIVSMGINLVSKGQIITSDKNVMALWFINYQLPNHKVMDELCFTNSITGKKYRNYDIIKISLKNMNKDATITSEMRTALQLLNSKNLDDVDIGTNEVLKEVSDVLVKLNKDEQELLYASMSEAKENFDSWREQLVKEKDEELVQKNEAIAKKDEAIAEKDETIAKKDEAIAEKNEMINSSIKALYNNGVSIEIISSSYNITVDEIKNIIG